MGFPPHSLTPAELAALLDAERHGGAFLAYRDGAGDLRLMSLDGIGRLTIGRLAVNDLALDWDAEASRTHAQLELVGGDWTVVDDGLSRNGSFVNGERVHRRRRLVDGDMLRLGRTAILFRAPGLVGDSTAVAGVGALAPLTEGERRVLTALCRPVMAPGGSGVPASNKEIADELHLSLPGVKTHVRALFAKLGIEDLPQYRKRTELAQRALESGLVSPQPLGNTDRKPTA